MKYIIFIFALVCTVIPGRGAKEVSKESRGQEKTRYVFIGVEACASRCHNTEEMGYEYNRWKETGHSRSYEVLTGKKALEYARKNGISDLPQDSPVCLKCHITGAGADSSSFGATYKKEDGVTCEACHKGEFNPKTFLPEKKDCLRCHNDSVHEVSPFDFNERSLGISHPRSKKKQVASF